MSNSGYSPMPPGYTTLRPAGEGSSGRVFLALPDPVVITARNQFRGGDEDGAVDFAVYRVVAVKISILVSHFADERWILQSINRQAHLHPSSDKIVSLIQSAPGPEPGWMVLSTMPICCDLHSVANPTIEAPPIGLVWLVFQEVYYALDFLQNTCSPPISHGDLQSGNVLLGFHDPDTETLPKVMLIDFGQGLEKRGGSEASELCNIVGEPGQLCLEEHDGEGASYDAMRDFVAKWENNDEFTDPLLEDIWNTYGTIAGQAIQALKTVEKQKICDRVLNRVLAVAREGEGSGDIWQAVRRILE